MKNVIIEKSWKKALKDQFKEPYFKNLANFVRNEYLTSEVFPPQKKIFSAFELCPIEKVRVVIIGQDPYHGPGQANGLSFAVDKNSVIPPSLRNIFKEIQKDLGIVPKQSGDLSRWAKQGVLLLNSVLTVSANSPASHKEKGWEKFTDAVIGKINSSKKNIVYMLWGNYAMNKGESINRANNLVLVSGHPSPFSAHLFHGNKHFSQCNNYLKLHNINEIDWR